MAPPKKSPSPSPAKAGRAGRAASAAKASKVTHLHVYLFVPNLLGYARVVLTAAAIAVLWTAPKGGKGDFTWVAGIAAYAASFILDYFDGFAARKLNQSSNFGAVLDMVVDRVSTMLLLMTLGARLDAGHWYVYAFLAALDYSSHWVQMYSSKGHHKSAESNKDKNIFVRKFYEVYPLFAYLCAGTEFFYILRAVLFFYPHPQLELATTVLLMPAAVMKNVVNVAQLCSGFEGVAKADAAAKNA